MDPNVLMQLLQMHQMMGGGQLPSYGQQPARGMPEMGADPSQQQHHGGGLSPLMALSPLGGLFASKPKAALSFLSPAFGFANLLGAFK